tara:strand:- start:1401 stop:1595 length:195 start_codon:yes stop_codon:yes gene_type:complete
MSMNKRIIDLIADRIEKGKREYNEEIDPNDGRDWQQEALEEILDGMVYTAIAIVKLIDKRKNNE